MARIAGVDLPRDKRVEIGLTYIYGIGRKTSNDILAATGVNPDTRVRDLTEDDIAKIKEYIDHNCRVEGDLRRDIAFDIKRLIEIGLLQRYPSPHKSSCPRSAFKDKRSYQKGQEKDYG